MSIEDGYDYVTTGPTPSGHAYRVTIGGGEYRSLGWLADRYTSAEKLWDACSLVGSLGPGHEVYAITMTEPAAWEYRDDVDAENGDDSIVPPCCGGSLADKLAAFHEAIL